MTLAELEREVALREAEGRDHVILTVRRKSEPRTRSPFPRVRVLPGVTGKMVGFMDGIAIVDVLVADLRKYLDRCANSGA